MADRLRVAQTHLSRLRGLLGTARLDDGEGLWIRPCRQVHMIGMRYPLDLAFLDADNRVVRVVASLRPGQISSRVPGAVSVLELPVGTLERCRLTDGAQLDISGHAPLAASLTGAGITAALSNVLLALLYVLFVSSHLAGSATTRRFPVVLPLIVLESIMVVLFLTRRQSLATSARPFDWVLGIVGTFLPLLLRATEPPGPLTPLGEAVQIVGLLLVVVATTFLGRSLGLVAANRGIKHHGIYGVIRHPMYAGYTLCNLGYLACFPTPRNIAIGAVTTVCFYLRAVVEERFLAQDSLYRDYMRRVRWRFVPHIH